MEYSIKTDVKNLKSIITIKNEHDVKEVILTALLVNHKSSPSGLNIYAQCAHSNTDYSGRFIKIDTLDSEIVYTIYPEWGWADDYLFSGSLLSVKTKYGTFLVDESGGLVDKSGYYDRRVTAADVEMIAAIEPYFKHHGESYESINKVLLNLDHLIESCAKMFHGKSWAACALKVKAELLKKQNRNIEAVQCCIDALFFNDKMTVKRLMNSLIKKESLSVIDIIPSPRFKKMKNTIEMIRSGEMKKSKDNWEHVERRIAGEPNLLPPVARIEIPINLETFKPEAQRKQTTHRQGLASRFVGFFLWFFR